MLERFGTIPERGQRAFEVKWMASALLSARTAASPFAAAATGNDDVRP
jgi:hypothetical protein